MAEKIMKDLELDDNLKLPEEMEIAILPLQNTTLFPDTVVPLADACSCGGPSESAHLPSRC